MFVLVIYRPIKWLITGYYYPKQAGNTLLSKWNIKSEFNMK